MSLPFKRLSGMKKVHDNSINITVDLWRRARDFFGALPCTFASLRSLTTSAKTVHRTVFFRRQVCSLLVRIPLFIFANAKSRPCDLRSFHFCWDSSLDFCAALEFESHPSVRPGGIFYGFAKLFNFSVPLPSNKRNCRQKRTQRNGQSIQHEQKRHQI